jgi:hypothetical protein
MQVAGFSYAESYQANIRPFFAPKPVAAAQSVPSGFCSPNHPGLAGPRWGPDERDPSPPRGDNHPDMSAIDLLHIPAQLS